MHHLKKKITKKLWLVKDVLTGDATGIHSACHLGKFILVVKNCVGALSAAGRRTSVMLKFWLPR
jgi:hypothetical protein